ncbi:MAG: hypothetical protein AB7G87_01190 [Clostridia bacterium]
MLEKICKNCWQWEQPDYSERPGKCVLKIFAKPYENTPSCDEFDPRCKEDDEKV